MKLFEVARQTLSFKLWTACSASTGRIVDKAGTRSSHGRLPAKTICAAEVAMLVWAFCGIFAPSALASPGPTNTTSTVNSPVLNLVNASGSITIVRGTVSLDPNSAYTIYIYDGAAPNGAGAAVIGSEMVTTGSSGNGSFSISIPEMIPAGSYVFAAAADSQNNISVLSGGLMFAAPSDAVNVGISVTAASNIVQLGQQLAFTVTVTNSGNRVAPGIVVNDVLPAGLNYASSISTQNSPSAISNDVTWNVGTLPPGGTAVMTIYAAPQAIGNYANLAVLSSTKYNISYASSTNNYPITIFSPSGAIAVSPPAGGILSGVLSLVSGVLGGGPSKHYQWRLNGANIPGATKSSYSKAKSLIGDNGLYTLVVSDGNDTSTSPGSLLGLNLGVILPPATDDFASRPDLGLLGITINGLLEATCDNSNATIQPGEPMHAGIPGGHSVWYKWTPLLGGLLGGIATVSTAGSSFDTTLAVYTGNNVSNLTLVASDDDSGGFYTSTVSFNITPGATYNIAIDGAYGATGQIVIGATSSLLGGLLSPPLPVITSHPTNQIVALGSTATFSVAASGSGLHYQWYHNGATVSGATSTSLLVKNVSASSVGAYTVQVSNSGHTVVSRAASLQVSTLDGSLNAGGYAVDKFQNAFTIVSNASQSTFNVSKQTSAMSFGTFDSHSVSDAGGGTSRGYSSTQIFSTYGGGTQTGEPNHCGALGGDSAWTYIQAADNGIMTIDTIGTTFSNILAVYTGDGNDFSSLTPVACDEGTGPGGASRVTFAATSNTVYYIAVDGVYGQSGTVELNANLSVPPAITAQPASQTVSPGAMINLATAVTGHVTPACQWWHNGNLLSGSTNGMLTLSNFNSSLCGIYQMTATNTVGAVVTTPVQLFVNTPMRLDSFNFDKCHSLCQMRLIGTAGTSYVIETSSNLVNWVPLATNTATTGVLNISDSHATNAQCYYRAVPGH